MTNNNLFQFYSLFIHLFTQETKGQLYNKHELQDMQNEDRMSTIYKEH
jgi:hypothetical protein